MGEKMISTIVLVGGSYDQKLLEKCLGSVAWTDEVVRVETDNLKGSFADWRDLGAKKAGGDWLLYVDTDEEITSELKNEILDTLGETQTCSAYAISRKNIIFGKEMRHCGLWPDYVLRLIKKDKLKGWEGELHEQPKIEGKIGYLKNPLIHNKHKTLDEMVEKTNDWSEIEAKLMFKAHHPKMNVLRFFSAGAREFWLRMIKQAAFLDGTEGIIYGLYQVFSKSISYAKLWELQLKK